MYFNRQTQFAARPLCQGLLAGKNDRKISELVPGIVYLGMRIYSMFIAVIFLISIYSRSLQWLDAHLLTCPSRKFLHLECPGCGFQRSVLALLGGDWAGSFRLYPATFPLLALGVYSMAHLLFQFNQGARIIKYLQLFAAIVILAFYIYKAVTHKLIV
jgi:hypothetical protein